MADLAGPIQLMRDTAADWSSNNPTLAQGEIGIETDTDMFKIGTGSTAWNSLGYYSPIKRLWLPASAMQSVTGSPTYTDNSAGMGAWSLDAASDEEVGGAFDIGQMEGWITFDIYAWTVTRDATASNNIRALCKLRYMADNATALSDIYNATTTEAITGGTNNRMQRHLIASAQTVPTSPPQIAYAHFYRDANDAADTFAADIGFAAFELVRAS